MWEFTDFGESGTDVRTFSEIIVDSPTGSKFEKVLEGWLNDIQWVCYPIVNTACAAQVHRQRQNLV